MIFTPYARNEGASECIESTGVTFSDVVYLRKKAKGY
jgi:hypothetical protein